MSSTHAFRFGIQVSKADGGTGWAELARRAEGNGFSVLTMPDHFDDQLAPVPALMAAAAATTTLRVGALVFDNDYKHPVVLAKELATIDVLSGGRLEIGLGAGWMISDYERSGMPYDAAGVRIDRFVEGVQIIRGLLGPEPFSFTGQHYTVTEMNGLPKPVQARPPLLIGGGGKRVLGIAAREADIVGINPSMHAGRIGPEAIGGMSPDSVEEKISIARAAAGARVHEIEWNVRSFLVNVTADAAAGRTARQQMAAAMGVDEAWLEASPFALIGPPEELAERLRERRERWGFSYVIVGGADVDSFAPVVAELAGT
ncbi:MAG: TIGR03621 family F420-dependent LLM class oxidoreductase [Acidimicrobiaceae bacterium]|nr:TIGR03621 family F420-dependent LLM class oxidoreductase [Ilumatobacter sp.]MCB9381250.1 TIGR03621 family F420-dependent LLM class oxidoreductase [Acidimicrobiaceae bacterium]MCO5330129.1 TIGR03621 family F420-dependent LLM class oxidoreductase [Ilumatobacteraceae bacterium]